MDKTNRNNVIELRLRTNLLMNRASLATDSRRFQNMIASGALATTLFLVTMMNLTLSSQPETQSNSRGPASVAPLIEGSVSNWDGQVLKRLALKTDRKMASISSRATALDQLRFGVLEGKYVLKLDEGKVSEIVYQETPGAEDRPKYINSKDEFLNQYRTVMQSDFATATRIEQKIDNGNIVESYQLLGSESKPVAVAKFTSDQYGRLISLKIVR